MLKPITRWFLAGMILCAGFCRAQTSLRPVEGTVRDSTGAVVSAARVAARGKTYKQSTVTARDGHFKIDGVPAEAISITVEAPGFARMERALSPLETTLDVVLSPAALSQEVNVTANRSEIRLEDTAESISLLPREALDVTAGEPVDDALRQVPGFTLFRRSDSREANPTSQGVSLRGIGASGASRALVLQNGVPLNDPFGGWVYWGRVPTESVGSIEVLRGGASSLYGSGALGGVINILPVGAERNLFSSEAAMATEGSPDFSATDSWKAGAWELGNGTEVFRTGGYILTPSDQRGTVDTPANSFHQAVQSSLRRNLRSGDLFATGSFYNETRHNGTELQKNDTQLWQIGGGADFTGAAGTVQARGYGGGESFNQTFSSVAANRNSETLVDAQHVPAQQIGASLLWSRDAGSRNSLVVGADSRDVRGLSGDLGFAAGRPRSVVDAGGRQLTSGVFGQDLIRLSSRLLFTAGLRYDNWNNYDAQSQTIPFVASVKPALTSFADHSEHALSPRGALLYSANRRLTLIASAYKSFRAPTLNELYRTFRLGNVVTDANSQLLAERLSGAEAGANLFLGRTRVHATFFWMAVSHPVENVTLSTTPALITDQRQNLGRTRSRGVEADAEWHVKKLDLRAGYQFVDAVVTSFAADPQLIGLDLPQVASHQFTLQSSFSMSRGWTVALLARAASSQFDDDLNQFSLAPFFQLDTYVSKRLRSGMEIFASVENVTNSRIEIARTPLLNVGPPVLARVGFKFRRE